MARPSPSVVSPPPAGAGDAPAWSAGLNPQQRAAVAHGEGPLLVVAGAGTGKTRMLVSRLARLIDTGVRPERILLVTFSRRAAAEMVRRAGYLAGAGAARRVHAGTFHAVAHRLLRTYGAALGLRDGWSVLDQADATDLMGLVRPGPSRAGGRRFARAATLLAIYSRVVNTGTPLDEVLVGEYPWCAGDREQIAGVFGAYTRRKQDQGLLDFDDLLVYWRAATADPSVGPAMAGLYDHVLVDEYQDTNVVQADILRCLTAGHRNLTVVGDDAQAIYGFRAATVDNLLRFDEQFAPTHPGAPAPARVTLEENYRSGQPILDLANAVMAGAGSGVTKTLWSRRSGRIRPVLATCPDEAAQAEAVCETIVEHLEAGIALREQAVLFRAAHHSDLLEVELGRRNLPFVKYGGLRFLEAAHVRDLVALLRVLDNPWDELAWTRILLLVAGVGPAGADQVVTALGVREPAGAGDPLARFVAGDRPCPRRADAEELASVAAALGDCRDSIPVAAQVERLADALAPILTRRYGSADTRIGDLRALSHLAGDGVSRGQLVADLTLDPPVSTGDLAGPPHLDDDYLVLSTVHSAKGGEWSVVHVIDAADGRFPSDMATGSAAGIDEERRLFYVALTRARDRLHLYAPLRYHHEGPAGWRDRHSYAARTRFLPPDLDHLLDLRAVRAHATDVATGMPVAGASDVTLAVDAALRDLW